MLKTLWTMLNNVSDNFANQATPNARGGESLSMLEACCLRVPYNAAPLGITPSARQQRKRNAKFC